MEICSNHRPTVENSKKPKRGSLHRGNKSGQVRNMDVVVEAEVLCIIHNTPRHLYPLVTVKLARTTVTQAISGHATVHIPIELPDGPESADIATATRQNREVVGVQGEKEAFCREFRLRKWRLISI